MLQQALMPFRFLFRAIGLVLALLWGVLATFLLLSLLVLGRRVHDRALQGFARHWFRLVQRTFGVRQSVSGTPIEGPALVAANHVSWLDIVVLGTHLGACFVSKSEVANWPVIGWLARRGGTLFIHRGRHDSAERIAHDMTARLVRGERLLFFPEGTTSDGTQVRRFRNRLFQPAVQVSVPVQPVAVRYARGTEAVDPVAYVAGVSLLRSALGVLVRRRTDVHVHWCEAIPVAGLERRDVAAMAEARVIAALGTLNTAGEGTAAL